MSRPDGVIVFQNKLQYDIVSNPLHNDSELEFEENDNTKIEILLFNEAVKSIT